MSPNNLLAMQAQIAKLQNKVDSMENELATYKSIYSATMTYDVLGIHGSLERVLRCLVKHSPQAVSKATLMDSCSSHASEEKVIDVHIHRLRQLLSKYEVIICTSRGYGYYITPDHVARLNKARDTALNLPVRETAQA